MLPTKATKFQAHRTRGHQTFIEGARSFQFTLISLADRCIRLLGQCFSHENPHPRWRGRLTENYRDRVSFPEGPRSKLTPGRRCRIMYTRGWPWCTRGDSSRYSLLMGVLFSGALGPPGTCHTSLGSRGTMPVMPSKRSQGTCLVSNRLSLIHEPFFSYSRPVASKSSVRPLPSLDDTKLGNYFSPVSDN